MLFPTQLIGQQINLDSLDRLIIKMPNDTLKVNKLQEIADELAANEDLENKYSLKYAYANKELITSLLDKTSSLRLNLKLKEKLAINYLAIGENYDNWTNLTTDSSRHYLILAETIFKEIKNIPLLGKTYEKQCRLEMKFNPELGLSYCKKAEEIFNITKNELGLAKLYEKYARMTMLKIDNELNINFLKSALQKYEYLKDTTSLLRVYEGIGNQYSERKEASNALKYYDKALLIYKSINDSDGIYYIIFAKATLALNTNDSNKALELFNESFDYTSRHYSCDANFLELQLIYKIYYSQKSIMQVFNTLQRQLKCCAALNDSAGLSMIYATKSDLALIYNEQFIKLDEHLTNFSTTEYCKHYLLKSITMFPKDYGNVKTSIGLKQVGMSSNFFSFQIFDKNHELSDSISSLTFLKYIHKNLSIVYEKLNYIDSAYIELKIANSINEAIQETKAIENKNRIRFQYAESSQATENKLQNDLIHSEKQKKEILLYASIVLFILLLYLIYSLNSGNKTNRKLNKAIITIQETQEKLIQQEQLSFEEKLAKQKAEQEMNLLRAQMNPHFIFNALNSIHNCILQKDTQTAASSLTKFSRLIRRILESTRQAVVSLENEISNLELYIQLEQMRFSNKFNYKISIDPEIDINQLNIPPLLLQPFVENSIWHGLMPSKNIGEILIDIRKQGENLHIKITDNGIGRKRASEIKNKEHNVHTSHGISITKDRLNVFNNQSMNSESFTIIDLYNDEGVPTGTQVEFDLAIQKDAA